jgi:SAM-dependent methyltransferase
MTLLRDLRPDVLEKECDRLMEIDRSGIDHSRLVAVPCVACSSNQVSYTFNKLGFLYNKCAVCQTLYLSPRLTQEDLNRFFTESAAMKYWAEALLPLTIDRRREIFSERFRKIVVFIQQLGYVFPFRHLLEVGPGNGLFLEQVKALDYAEKVSCVEPSVFCCERIKRDALADFVYPLSLDEWKPKDKYDIIVCNGVIEHPHDVIFFVRALRKVLSVGGVMIFCSPGADGLDTALCQYAPNIEPPQMQNFLSRRGWEFVAERCDLKMPIFESIGEIDSEIVSEQISKESSPFAGAIHRIFQNQDFRREFQVLLQRFGATGFQLNIFQKGK